MNLIAHGLTPILWSSDIRSLSGFGTRWRALVQSVLYLQNWTNEASPKTISERTSYRQVCLAFHPYPQLITAFFNTRVFGPPQSFTCASTWPWIAHLASGLLYATYTHYSYSVSLRLRDFNHLILQHTITRRLIMQKARSHTLMVLLRLVGYRFQVLFHSPPGVLFAFPSRYLFTIGHCVVFSLGWWSTRIPTGFLVSRRTQDTLS